MAESRFVYVTYIRTTPAKLWQALIEPEFTRQYWVEAWHESAWKPGSSWRLMLPDGRVADSGEILEIEPERRLVIAWRNEFKPEMHEDGYSRMTCELEQQGESVKLTIVHESEKPDSKLIEGVSNGWPLILASLKSLLETGELSNKPAAGPRGTKSKVERSISPGSPPRGARRRGERPRDFASRREETGGAQATRLSLSLVENFMPSSRTKPAQMPQSPKSRKLVFRPRNLDGMQRGRYNV